MQVALYIIWFLIPLFFFLMALWVQTEKWSGKASRENVKDYIKQGGFVLLCVLLSVGIDYFAIARMDLDKLPSWLPPNFLRVFILPLVLYIAALIIGPTRDIRIEREGKLSKEKEKKKRVRR